MEPSDITPAPASHLPAAGQDQTGVGDDQPRVRVSSPVDVLAVVPRLLGFHPARSLVVIGAGGPRNQVELGFRYDLPDPPDSATAADIAAHATAVLARQGATTVIAAGYGPGPLVTPVVDVFAAAAREEEFTVRELLRVEDGRYWSYLCQDVRCCPPEGVPFDLGCHPASAAMTAAGMPAFPDRAARAATLAQPPDLVKGMEEAAGRACDRATRLMTAAQRRGVTNPLMPVIRAGRAAVAEAIGTYRAGGRISADDAIAWLAVTMANLAVRDDAWARMDPAHREPHQRLWTDVVRRVGDLWTPAPAALLAFTAWQCGDGVLANLAIERALAADPRYSMALLLRDVIDAGVPPSAALAPMTPEEVAASYEQAGRGRPGRKRRR